MGRARELVEVGDEQAVVHLEMVEHPRFVLARLDHGHEDVPDLGDVVVRHVPVEESLGALDRLLAERTLDVGVPQRLGLPGEVLDEVRLAQQPTRAMVLDRVVQVALQ